MYWRSNVLAAIKIVVCMDCLGRDGELADGWRGVLVL